MTELRELLEPQERLDRLIASSFRRFGPKLADLSYANPHDGPPQEVLNALRRVTEQRKGLAFQYTSVAGRTATRRAIADHLASIYGLPFDFQDVIMTAGAMPALNVVLRALFGPEDEVLVLTPAWQNYSLYLRNLDIPMTLVPLRHDKHLDLEAIGRAIGPSTRGVLFSQPCCPTGVLYSEEEMAGICQVVADAEGRFGSEISVVSDEVHRGVVWGGGAFVSPLRSHARGISIYSFGKALALQGQRIGYIAVSPRMPRAQDVRRRLERCLQVMGFGSPNSLMQYAVCDLLDYKPALSALAKTQACVRRTLADYGYDVCDGDATFYVYVRSPIADDFRFAELLASHGVLVVPSTLFHERGFIRLSLTARSEAIAAALPVFGRVRGER